MYTDNDFRLYHHGILGQRWGVRNGPPYPLGSGDHSTGEVKTKRNKDLLKSTKDFRNQKNGKTKDDKKSPYQLSDAEKQAIIFNTFLTGDTTLAAILLAAYGIYKLNEKYAESHVSKGKEVVDEILDEYY